MLPAELCSILDSSGVLLYLHAIRRDPWIRDQREL
eukprot:COSAG01_NODE_40149_length_467_cov_0.839674_1_plen_34_part_10